MYALTLAAQGQSALLDWNNNFAEDRNKCVCTHCGNFPKSFVRNDLKLGTLGVLGRTLGKVNTFGAVFPLMILKVLSRLIWVLVKSRMIRTEWMDV